MYDLSPLHCCLNHCHISIEISISYSRFLPLRTQIFITTMSPGKQLNAWGPKCNRQDVRDVFRVGLLVWFITQQKVKESRNLHVVVEEWPGFPPFFSEPATLQWRLSPLRCCFTTQRIWTNGSCIQSQMPWSQCSLKIDRKSLNRATREKTFSSLLRYHSKLIL